MAGGKNLNRQPLLKFSSQGILNVTAILVFQCKERFKLSCKLALAA